MRKFIGYTLITIPFLCVLFIGIIISVPWWLGVLSVGIAAVCIYFISIGVELIGG